MGTQQSVILQPPFPRTGFLQKNAGQTQEFLRFYKIPFGPKLFRNRNASSESIANSKERYLSGSEIAKPCDADQGPSPSVLRQRPAGTKNSSNSRSCLTRLNGSTFAATTLDSAIEGYIDPAGPNKTIEVGPMMNEVIDSPTLHAKAEIRPVRIADPSYSSAKDSADANEQMLVASAKLGEAAAFVTLCNRHSDKILRRLYRITKNWEDAEDALQDSFLKAFVHLNKFEGRSSFSSWLTRIAINSALMLLRRKRARNEVSMEIPGDAEHAPQPRDIIDSSQTPEHRYAQCESRERLDNAIPRLRPCFRTVVELHHFHEQSAAQIAETLNISVPAVKSRLLRAKSALRKSIVRNQVSRALPPAKARDSRPALTSRNANAPYVPLQRAEAQL